MTPGALWSHRALLALDELGSEHQRRYRELIGEIMSVVGQRTTIIEGRGWQPNPHYRDRDREAELWDELGELLGIGPRPRSMELMVDRLPAPSPHWE